MAGKYILYSLDVGQGMGTFVTYYDSNDVLTAIALFDIGSSHNKWKIEESVVDFLAEKIIERSSPDPDGYLDAMFISHKDSDHVNLIQQLLDKVPDATIGQVRYSGRYSWYKKSAGNILDELNKRVKNKKGKASGFPIGHSYWYPKEGVFKNPIWQSDGNKVVAYLLAVNTPYKDEVVGDPETDISARPDGDQANSKSLVVALSMNDTWAIISGDATYPTFQYICGFFKVQFGANIMTLLPHHGSRKTTFGLPSTDAEISKEAKKVVNTFAKNMNGLTVVASADTMHSHPSLETIELFLPYTDQKYSWWPDPNLGSFHYVTVRIDIDIENEDDELLWKIYTTYQTAKNVYSTLYFDSFYAANPPFTYPPYKVIVTSKKRKMNPTPSFSPAEGKNWVYYSNGTVAGTELKGEDSGRLSALTKMLLQREPIGLPPEALPAPAPLVPTVSVRQAMQGQPRPAIAAPRAASAFSRLVRVL